MRAASDCCSRVVCVILCLVFAFEPALLQAAASTRATSKAPQTEVRVNRSVPKVEPPAAKLTFSHFPSDLEIAQARALPGPLLALGAPLHPARLENRSLAEALLDYHRRGDPELTRPLTRFLEEYPGSRWEASLLVNLGMLYKQQGRVSRAFPALERAWSLTRDRTDRDSMAVANWALAEGAEMHAHLDPVKRGRLDTILNQLGSRDLHGPATEKVRLAFAGWAMRERHPEEAFRCGPVSLAMLRAYLGMPRVPEIESAVDSTRGFSLAGLEALANGHGMQMRAAHVEPGAAIPVRALIHWKYDHYSAILEQKKEGAKEYFRIQNPLLDGDHWMSRDTLEEEASGYYLVPNRQMQPGWRSALQEEAAGVWGRCEFTVPDLTQLMDWAIQALCGGAPAGMPTYNFHLALASLTVTDIPLGYTPPIGPPVQFRITYHQRESFQPAVFNYSNLGPKWTFGWLSYVASVPDGKVYLRNGGVEQYHFVQYVPSSLTQGPLVSDYGHNLQSHAQLLLTAGLGSTAVPSFERRLPDGSKEVFAQSSGSSSGSALFLSQIVDAQGNAITFTYDSQMRIVSVKDAIGQVTTLSYGLASDPLKITKVTDPFGRSTILSYDSNGHLTQITDVIGMTSTFTYGANDFISSMSTPYGTTSFQAGQLPDLVGGPLPPGLPPDTNDPMNVYIQATDPNGDTERAEFRNLVPSLPVGDAWNGALASKGPQEIPFLNTRLSFYWDKKAWKQAPGDYAQAKAYRWLYALGTKAQTGVLDFFKNPLEGRVVFEYPSQDGNLYYAGSSAMPSAVLRLLEDGKTQQTTLIGSNDFGRITRLTDPAGRQMSYLYDSTGVDLLEVRQGNDLLARFAYNSQHLPTSYTDASGGTAAYTYNSAGQPLSVTNAKQETTRYTYDAHGYLTQITAPLPSATARLTYDSYGRPQTITDSEGYTVAYTYDALDRLTKITYPDKTSDQVSYDKLDPVALTDRQGRVTRAAYDALRRPLSITDPLGRTTTLDWCACGALVSVTDPAGNTTNWNRDIQNRVMSKTLADGSATQYSYDLLTGRLAQVTVANGQIANLSYFPDGDLQQISYSNMAPVSLTYDTNYNRLTSYTDGTGTTTLSYVQAGSPGGLQIASVAGPRGEVTAYTYDVLGRVASRSIDGSAMVLAYDALGRVTNESNPLGRFGFTYMNATGRLLSMSYPNGQAAQYSYFDNVGDQRLKQIAHQRGDKSVISQFTYTYQTTGEINTLAMLKDSYIFNYDAASQLTGASLASGGAYGYAYDPAGNRVTEQTGAQTNASVYNNVNELMGDAAQQFTYDDNGNLLTDGQRTFEWDAENRLAAVNIGTHRSEFSYDGLDQRVRIVEKESGAIVNDKQLIWCGAAVCEERDSATGVNKRFFAEGELQISNGAETPYYYTLDDLGSLREMTDASGAVVASYDYDPWGRTTKLSGKVEASYGYAGYYAHSPSGLYLTQYRAYDPALGRWLTRDPLGESGGQNLYAYVGNSPINGLDQLGLAYQLGAQYDAQIQQIEQPYAQQEQQLQKGVKCRANLVFGIATFIVGALPALEGLFVGAGGGAAANAAGTSLTTTSGPGTSLTTTAGPGTSLITTGGPGTSLITTGGPGTALVPVARFASGEILREWAREKLAQEIGNRAAAKNAAENVCWQRTTLLPMKKPGRRSTC